MSRSEEFGQFLASRDIRRTIHFAILIAGFGIAIAGDLGTSNPRLSEGKVDRDSHDANKRESGNLAARITAKSPGTALDAESSSSGRLDGCRAQEWPYLDRNCLVDSSEHPQKVRVIPIVAPERASTIEADINPLLSADPTIGATRKPQKAAQVRKPARPRANYNSAVAAYATHYSPYRDVVYRDRGWSW
jgi:hypothetical protein